MEGGELLEDDRAYLLGYKKTREILLEKYDAQEEFKKHTEVRQPPSKKPSVFKKVKEGVKKLFS